LGQDVTFHGVTYNSAGNPDQLVTISTDFLVTPASGAIDWEALTAGGNGGFITQIIVTGKGQVCAFNPCSGPILTANTWYNLSMQLDYATDTVKDFVNGMEFSSGSFDDVPALSTTLSSIGIGVNDNFIDGTTHTASWDNILVTSSAVPEPAAWAVMLIGFGMIGGLARRRKAAAPA
ncbi:MAG TPA: PEPxxWA-CTERM sorting domain-containing protein, partial [Caulobacteraceae bacterium]|jgi:hypothetical protein|nr:PEPxxWA-CTERM sorting domain-containing protein [Caulobacteraceae bacterium]